MKKIIFAIITVICVCLLFSCGSAPTSISQEEMKLNDPRMPRDRFNSRGELEYYWFGSQVPELSEKESSVFQVTRALRNLHINGKRIGISNVGNGYIYLLPGKYTLTFSYYDYQMMPELNAWGKQTGNNVRVNVDFPIQTVEINMMAGKLYQVIHIISDETFETRQNIFAHMGLGQRTYSTALSLQESNILSFFPSTLEEVKNRKYLIPYDSSVPFEDQAFLEVRDGVTVVGFNGQPVRWGWERNYSVTIGIPSGEHVIQLERNRFNDLDFKFQYETEILFLPMNINFIPGHRYVIDFTKDLVKTTRFLDKDSYTFGFTATDVTGGLGNPITVTTNDRISYDNFYGGQYFNFLAMIHDNVSFNDKIYFEEKYYDDSFVHSDFYGKWKDEYGNIIIFYPNEITIKENLRPFSIIKLNSVNTTGARWADTFEENPNSIIFTGEIIHGRKKDIGKQHKETYHMSRNKKSFKIPGRAGTFERQP